MNEPITVDQVSLSTPTVTIRMLEVGGRKMTLAIFKQIPIESAWGKSDLGKVVTKGPLWGVVVWERQWVLWQKDLELRRWDPWTDGITSGWMQPVPFEQFRSQEWSEKSLDALRFTLRTAPPAVAKQVLYQKYVELCAFGALENAERQRLLGALPQLFIAG